MSGFNYEIDTDGIVTVTMDMAGPVNTMNADYRELMGSTVERLEKQEGLTGVVITSAKPTFFAGGDLREMAAAQPGDGPVLFANIERLKSQLRRLEKLPVPVVAAINGAALGGGFEICLAANHRVIVADPKAVIGLPEVTLGLLPGGGGIVRMVNLLGCEAAVPYLLEGKRVSPADALSADLVGAIVPEAALLVQVAKDWIRANPTAWAQPWDRKGHKVPGGNLHRPEFCQWLSMATVMLAKKTRGLLPAPGKILSIAAEATTLGFDAALRVESRGLAGLILTPEAKNLINSTFFQLNQVNGGAARPKHVPKAKVARLGILGAGMMGQGIAYAAAMAGINVVLRDITMAAAEKGKAYTERLLAARVKKGSLKEDQAQAVLARILPTDQATDLKGVDLIVEAVFEDVDLKAQVTRETESFLAEGGVYGSNTSTLPISLLAKASERPSQFIGIHFFSPVDKMPLVEIICGEQTSEETLAKAFDFARQIGKTPIVVNDSVGFYTSRTYGVFLDEGMRMLAEGVSPAQIENVSRAAGMPVGPLAGQDEVGLELTRKVTKTQRALGLLFSRADTSVGVEVCERMISEHSRGGRAYGGGFYQYAEDGSKALWSGLADFVGKRIDIPVQDVRDRILFRQAIETVKCLQEGVLRNVPDGNIGGLMGIGAPAWTGGWLQFINTFGFKRFVARARELEQRYGERFTPPQLLLEHAEGERPFE